MANLLTKQFARKKAPVNPRKVSTGTSYQAKGIAPTPQTDTESGSSMPIQIRELVPELASPFSRLQAYRSMMNDSSVDVSMRAAKTPILGAEFFMEPFSDDPLDQEVSEFCWANLAEGMSAPLLNTLEDILHFFEDGHSIVEKVYEHREWAPKRTKSAANTKQFVMLQKLGFRPTETIKEIMYDDNGGPESVIQNVTGPDGKPKEVEMKIDKVLIFSFNKRGGDLTGKSLLRTAYQHWFYKKHFYKIDAIQKERFSLGVLRGKLLPGWTDDDRKTLRTLLRNYRANEEQFFIQTPNVEIEVEFPGGTPVDVLSSAVHHNAMILLNILGQFITEGEGRATAGTKSDLFMKSLRYVANHIADQINMYIIPELVVWNYPTRNFPRLQVRNIGETRDLQMLAAAIANLYAQDAVTHNWETEMWTRKIFDMPSIPQAEFEQAIKEVAAKLTNGDGNGDVKLTPQDIKAAKGNVKQKAGDGGNVGKPPGAAN